MKGQKLCKAYLFATVFCVFYLLHPSLSACQPNPTNYFQINNAMPVDEAIVVPGSDERPQPKFVALAIAFAIAVAVIGYILYQIIKLLDKVIPPPDKKVDPPPQAPTNSPPVTINPSGSPGPASLIPHKFTVGTNTPSWGTIPYYDIGGLWYEVLCEKFSTKQYFDGYWSTGVVVSTNSVNWEDTHYRVDAYVCHSAHSVFYEYYHYGTNFYNAYFTADYIASNHVAPAYFNLTDRPKQEIQFFRLAPRSL